MDKYKLRLDGFREGYGCFNVTNATSKHWATRTVRNDLSVKIGGTIFFCSKDTDIPPIPGERILFGRYQSGGGYESYVNEWACPADSDGFLRRMFWHAKKERM